MSVATVKVFELLLSR